MEKNPNNVAKRILFWLEEEDKKRTNTARARGEIESLETIKVPKPLKIERLVKPDQVPTPGTGPEQGQSRGN